MFKNSLSSTQKRPQRSFNGSKKIQMPMAPDNIEKITLWAKSKLKLLSSGAVRPDEVCLELGKLEIKNSLDLNCRNESTELLIDILLDNISSSEYTSERYVRLIFSGAIALSVLLNKVILSPSLQDKLKITYTMFMDKCNIMSNVYTQKKLHTPLSIVPSEPASVSQKELKDVCSVFISYAYSTEYITVTSTACTFAALEMLISNKSLSVDYYGTQLLYLKLMQSFSKIGNTAWPSLTASTNSLILSGIKLGLESNILDRNCIIPLRLFCDKLMNDICTIVYHDTMNTNDVLTDISNILFKLGIVVSARNEFVCLDWQKVNSAFISIICRLGTFIDKFSSSELHGYSAIPLNSDDLVNIATGLEKWVQHDNSKKVFGGLIPHIYKIYSNILYQMIEMNKVNHKRIIEIFCAINSIETYMKIYSGAQYDLWKSKIQTIYSVVINIGANLSEIQYSDTVVALNNLAITLQNGTISPDIPNIKKFYLNLIQNLYSEFENKKTCSFCIDPSFITRIYESLKSIRIILKYDISTDDPYPEIIRLTYKTGLKLITQDLDIPIHILLYILMELDAASKTKIVEKDQICTFYDHVVCQADRNVRIIIAYKNNLPTDKLRIPSIIGEYEINSLLDNINIALNHGLVITAIPELTRFLDNIEKFSLILNILNPQLISPKIQRIKLHMHRMVRGATEFPEAKEKVVQRFLEYFSHPVKKINSYISIKKVTMDMHEIIKNIRQTNNDISKDHAQKFIIDIENLNPTIETEIYDSVFYALFNEKYIVIRINNILDNDLYILKKLSLRLCGEEFRIDLIGPSTPRDTGTLAAKLIGVKKDGFASKALLTMATFQESLAYLKRIVSTKACKAMISGELTVALVPNESPIHIDGPFPIGIADGFGLINEDLAKILISKNSDRFVSSKYCSFPWSSLSFINTSKYPESIIHGAAKELSKSGSEKLYELLTTQREDPLGHNALRQIANTLGSGNPKAKAATVIPSPDGKIWITWEKAFDLGIKPGEKLILAKSPPHKNGLVAINSDEINIINELIPVFQFSLIGLNEQKDIIGFKGLLGVIRSKYWPNGFPNIVLPINTMKLNSCWRTEFDRLASQKLIDPVTINLKGILSATTGLLNHNMVIALPQNISELNIDFDGDIVTILVGLRVLSNLITDKQRRVKDKPTIKLIKSFTAVNHEDVLIRKVTHIIKNTNLLGKSANLITLIYSNISKVPKLVDVCLSDSSVQQLITTQEFLEYISEYKKYKFQKKSNGIITREKLFMQILKFIPEYIENGFKSQLNRKLCYECIKIITNNAHKCLMHTPQMNTGILESILNVSTNPKEVLEYMLKTDQGCEGLPAIIANETERSVLARLSSEEYKKEERYDRLTDNPFGV